MPEKKEAKLVAVGELFTVNEIVAALKLYKESQVGFVTRVCEQILTDEVMARIDAKVGHANDKRYIAYILEYCVQNARGPAAYIPVFP